MSARNRLVAFIALGFALVLLPAVAGAQDEQPGKPVWNLEVSLKHKKDGAEKTGMTNDEGNFRFGRLNPGTYKLRLACKRCGYDGLGQRSGKYVFYVSVNVTNGRRIYETVKMRKMAAGVEFTVEIAEGMWGEITGRVTGAWDEDGEIKPPTIKPPTE